MDYRDFRNLVPASFLETVKTEVECKLPFEKKEKQMYALGIHLYQYLNRCTLAVQDQIDHLYLGKIEKLGGKLKQIHSAWKEKSGILQYRQKLEEQHKAARIAAMDKKAATFFIRCSKMELTFEEKVAKVTKAKKLYLKVLEHVALAPKTVKAAIRCLQDDYQAWMGALYSALGEVVADQFVAGLYQKIGDGSLADRLRREYPSCCA